MSMTHTPARDVAARIDHRCTNCGEAIPAGASYKRWISFDGSVFTNKMHPECLRSLQADCDYGSFEYSLYGGERPAATLPEAPATEKPAP